MAKGIDKDNIENYMYENRDELEKYEKNQQLIYCIKNKELQNQKK